MAKDNYRDEERNSEDEEEVKIDKWDGSAVKNTLDDAVKKVFIEKLEFSESHKLMDIRLFICITAVSAAMYALVYDYIHPFPDSKSVLISCVVSYFFLMGVLTLYTTMVEKGIFLVALQKDPSGMDPTRKWTVSSNLKRFDDQYELCIEYDSGKGMKPLEANMTKSCGNWFHEDGLLNADKFEADVRHLHNSIKAGKKSN